MNAPTKEELDEAIESLKHDIVIKEKAEELALTILTRYRDGELVEIMGDTKPNPIDPIEHATWHALRSFKRLPSERQLELFRKYGELVEKKQFEVSIQVRNGQMALVHNGDVLCLFTNEGKPHIETIVGILNPTN